MKSVSVAELKARLSEYLAAARRGDDVIVTDRGRPVARLTGLGAEATGARMAELVRSGAVRPPRRTADAARTHAAATCDDPDSRLLRSLLQERAEGR